MLLVVRTVCSWCSVVSTTTGCSMLHITAVFANSRVFVAIFLIIFTSFFAYSFQWSFSLFWPIAESGIQVKYNWNQLYFRCRLYGFTSKRKEMRTHASFRTGILCLQTLSQKTQAPNLADRSVVCRGTSTVASAVNLVRPSQVYHTERAHFCLQHVGHDTKRSSPATNETELD